MTTVNEFLEYLQEQTLRQSNIDPKQYLKTLDLYEKKAENWIEDVLNTEKEFSSPEEISEMRKHMKENIEKVKKLQLPSKYENRSDYSMLLDFAEDIENTISSFGYLNKQTGINYTLQDLNMNIVRPTFGTVPIRTLNAASYGGFKNNEYLIVFGTETFHCCNLLSKIIAQCFPYTKEDNHAEFIFDEKQVLDRTNNETSILNRFQQMFLAYLIRGQVRAAPQYYLEAPFSYLASHLRYAMEVFIMGHEYSHILLRHVDSEKSQKTLLDIGDAYNIMFEWPQEYEADALGLPLMLLAPRLRDRHNDPISYSGAELLFSCDEIIQRAECILRTGKEDWYWKGGQKDGAVGDHPPPHERRKQLRNTMKHQFGDKSVETSLLIEKITSILWEKTKPIFIDVHEKYLQN
ncbi:hypothetical protein [Candidatus Nitrosotenuis cloacae]|uniref:hypothetical protein n=1 Tax=Candidatus Nitrosotenuis cloacae TaxID=1603555 RepID=UPI00227F5A4F|nr:hypothetical protein [Candidatus Nitrosotenuis cloacae]